MDDDVPGFGIDRTAGCDCGCQDDDEDGPYLGPHLDDWYLL